MELNDFARSTLNFFIKLRDRLLDIPRYSKRAMLTVADLMGLIAVLYAALWLRYGQIFVPDTPMGLIVLLSGPVITVGILWHFGVYRMVTRFMGRRGNTQIIAAVALSVPVWALALFMVGQHGVPRSVIISYGVLGAGWIIALRQLIRVMLESADINFVYPVLSDAPRTGTLIYGADQLGLALLRAIGKDRSRYVVGFVDSSPNLWRQYVGGLKVYPPQHIERIISRDQIQEVLIALPGNRRQERSRVVQDLQRFPVRVKILPTYEDVARGHVSVDSLREVEVSDIVGRDAVRPHDDLMDRTVSGKSVLITGASGSIGSELVRQIALRAPRKLVLLDMSESGLHGIAVETRRLIKDMSVPPEIKIVLGSVTNAQLMEETIVGHGIETIYHSAAYKHVPIVEDNLLSGVENNVIGTATAALCARRLGVERFVLISTDKAVRPTSVMGATKRFAELVLQAEAASTAEVATVFTMVRFGNVLESSGSVVPLFRQQIRAGGPITVTDPNTTRYFMSIPEAAQLVIQAGAMAKGGEVFVLDMGAPVRIDDLARLMVRMFNFEVRDEGSPRGDIEIVYTGLRPGEKLHEELLIGGNVATTEHPRIFRSEEPYLTRAVIERQLGALRQALAARDAEAVKDVLWRTIMDQAPDQPLPLSPQKSPLRQ